MSSPLVGWTPGRVKREAQEHHTLYSGQGGRGLRLGGHAAAKRFAAGDDSKLGEQAQRFTDGRADSGLSNLWRIRSLAALFHVRKLIAQRGYVAFGEAIGDGRHKGMRHASPRAVCENITYASGAAHLQ